MSNSPNAFASSSKSPHEKLTKKKSKKSSKSSTSQTTPSLPNGHHASVSIAEKSSEMGKEKSKSKGKDKERDTPYQYRKCRMRLSIPPRWSADYLGGVKDHLDGLIMRYVAQLQGVLLAHWDHDFLDDTVRIINECPFGVAEVEFQAIVWSPKLGQKLYGSHSLSSPSHLSLLFSRTFNISIPLQHIPLDKYEFQATDPDDIPEDSEDEEEGEGEDTLVNLPVGRHAFVRGINGSAEEVGRWVMKDSGKTVGEGGKGIKFTVIGMQVVNQMLSLTGSLLSDPSNPPPPPPTTLPISTARIDSPTPEPAQEHIRPAKQAKYNQPRPQTAVIPASQPGISSSQPNGPDGVVAPDDDVKEEIDERYISKRELKQRHKEEKRKKRDERKERKEGRVMEVEQILGGGMAVGMNGASNGDENVGEKRKGDEASGGRKKKRRDQA